MKKKNLIIVGKKSFIGSNIYKFLKKKKKLLILSFKDFMKLPDSTISKYDYVCNCSVNKKNVKNDYKKKFDFDLKIAEKIEKIDTTFIFLSSRKVYKPKRDIYENSKLQPIDIDSKNKVISENLLKKKLKSKLLILRISNVIGLKKNKKYRQIHKTFFDNYLDIVKKNKKIKFYNQFKDFITIDQLSKIFFYLLKKRLHGVYNVSLGQKIYIKEILNWLNKKNKKKKNFIYINKKRNEHNKHSFSLNNSKLSLKINYKPKKIELKRFCLKLSRIIH